MVLSAHPLITIREYSHLGDNQALIDMYVKLPANSMPWVMSEFSKEEVLRWDKKDSGRDYIAMVAIAGARLIGHGRVFWNSIRHRKGVGGLLVHVHPDYRGRGIGKSLTSALLERAKAAGFHRIEGSLAVENIESLRMCLGTGFSVEGVKKSAYLGPDGKYHDEIMIGKLL